MVEKRSLIEVYLEITTKINLWSWACSTERFLMESSALEVLYIHPSVSSQYSRTCHRYFLSWVSQLYIFESAMKWIFERIDYQNIFVSTIPIATCTLPKSVLVQHRVAVFLQTVKDCHLFWLDLLRISLRSVA